MKKNNLKIISWNVNGIRSNYKKGFLDLIKREKPGTICLQEIKANIEDIPEGILSLKGYYIYINSAKKKGYSGTMVLTKERPLTNSFSMKFKKFDSEGRMIALNYKSFVLINFYIPQGGRDKFNIPYKLKAYEKLFSYIKKVKNKNIILIGDFNIAHKEIDLARPKQNKKNTMFTEDERKQLDKLVEKDFIDSFRIFNKEGNNYTWWPYFADAKNRNLGWRIDYAFVSKAFSKYIKNAYILKEVYGSDHAPIVLEINQEN